MLRGGQFYIKVIFINSSSGRKTWCGQRAGHENRADDRDLLAIYTGESAGKVHMETRRDFLIATAMSAAGAQGNQAARPLVIDCHTHVGTGTELIAPWTTIGDPEEILRRNKEAGIDKACIFPISHD